MSSRSSAGTPGWAGFHSADAVASPAFRGRPFDWEGTALGSGRVVIGQPGAAVAGGGPLIGAGQFPGRCARIGVEGGDRSAPVASAGAGPDERLVGFGVEEVAATSGQALGLGATAGAGGQKTVEPIDPQGGRLAVGPLPRGA